MVGKLIVALIVIVSAIYVTNSKEEIDGADLAKELADARVMAADKRTDAVREELREMELRALAGEQRAKKIEEQVAALEKALRGKGEPAIEVHPATTPNGDRLVTPGAQELEAVTQRISEACIAGTEARGHVQARLNVRKDGSVLAASTSPYGEKMQPFEHCLRTELEKHRFTSVSAPLLVAIAVSLENP